MTLLADMMRDVCGAASSTTLDTSPVDVFRGAAGGMLGATERDHAPSGEHTKDFSLA